VYLNFNKINKNGRYKGPDSAIQKRRTVLVVPRGRERGVLRSLYGARLQANWVPTSRWRKGSKLAQESPEHKLSGLLDQRSLAEDPPVIRLARLIQSTSLRMSAYVGQLVRM
jgi:hypothetical protein